MEPKGFHRKLTTILSADVAGYSRLMQDDETATVKTLKAYKQIISDLVKQHRGRVVDSPGDNLLAEFASVVDAVQCAVLTQKELQAHNADLPENRRMMFRIGVNLGDVIEEDSCIYGDGVNIAARLESLAEPGDICVSKTAFEHIEFKLPYGYAYLGEQTVKSIAKPIGAYKVLMGRRGAAAKTAEKQPSMAKGRMWVFAGAVAILVIFGAAAWQFYRGAASFEPASKEKMAFPLPDMPSIAVLPFANKSEDTKMDLFCHGTTDNIITALSRFPEIMVIARNSTFTYKGNPVKVKQVSESLGVRYVLEGSVQKSGDRIRITVQLFDALKGIPEWAETYDRELTDIFVLQDEIAMKILIALRVELAVTGERPSFLQKHYRGKQGLDCYTKLLQATGHISRWNLEDVNLGRRLAEEIIAMCPETPLGYTLLGWYYHHAYTLDPAISREQALEKSMELAQQAINIDDSISDSYSLLCSCYFLKGELENAIAECERAVSLNPGSMDNLSEYGWSLTFAGRNQEAIQVFQKIIRRNPYAKAGVYRGIGLALLFIGQLEEAASAFKTAVQRSPNDVMAHMFLAGAYSMQGREKEAAFEASEAFRINPQFLLENFVKRWSGMKDEARRDALMNAVRKAALAEKETLAQP